MKTVILAFSGGLDTSYCLHYLQDQGYQVITATINTGGFTSQELQEIEAKAKEWGAIKHYTLDAQKDLYEEYASYLIKANYLKGNLYPACVGPERNVIAEHIALLAEKEKTNLVAHGSTGAGNDHVRLDTALKALIPNVEILTPIRDQDLTRMQSFEYLLSKGIDLGQETKDYSVNVGLLGTTYGGKETLDTKSPLPQEIFPTESDKDPQSLSITFEKGLPISLNGKSMTGVKIIQKLNAIGDLYHIGKDYHIGTTIVGLKGRIGFSAPAMTILIKAHEALGKIVLTSKQLFWKNHLGTLYGDLLHEGLSCEPLARNIEAFLDDASQNVSGTVELKLSPHHIEILSLESPHTLFNTTLGSYGESSNAWSGTQAQGFAQLYATESIQAFLTNQS